MPDKCTNTKFTDFANILSTALKNEKNIPSILNIISNSIPVHKKKRVKKIDCNLESTFFLKRVNYNITAKIISVEPGGDKGYRMYTAQILTVESGTCPFKLGETLPISEWELSMNKLISHL